VAWIVVLTVIVVGGVVASASASGQSACLARSPVASAANACYPKAISGSFSGSGTCFTWAGTVLLKGRREQTEYHYQGRATYGWKFKPAPTPCLPEAGCTASPDHGTINELVGISVDNVRSKRGWGYDGGNGGGGGTKDVVINCGDPQRAFPQSIDNAFAPGGFTKSLRTFAGSTKTGSAYSFKWSFHGTR
jgi:hypothetical protein